MIKYIFSFDVESIGLYGEGFAVGYSVWSIEGKEIDKGVGSCYPEECTGLLSNRKWINQHVLPLLDKHKFTRPRQLRQWFWELYQKYKSKYKEEIIFIADCSFPVESNFLSDCVRDKEMDREWEAPYPLYDLSTLLFASGLNSIGNYERLPNELPQHNPLCDARQSGRIGVDVINYLNQLQSDCKEWEQDYPDTYELPIPQFLQ